MTGCFLRSHRLLLRPHRLSDAPFMVELNRDPECVRWTGDGPLAGPAEALPIIAALQRQFAERRMGRLIVEDAVGPVGWCGLKWHPEEDAADLGFRFLRGVWGRGYATEAGRLCLDWADGEAAVPRVFASAMPANGGSCRVLQKLGFTPVGAPDDDGFVRFERR